MEDENNTQQDEENAGSGYISALKIGCTVVLCIAYAVIGLPFGLLMSAFCFDAPSSTSNPIAYICAGSFIIIPLIISIGIIILIWHKKQK